MNISSSIRSGLAGVLSVATMLLVACTSATPPQTSTQAQTPAQLQPQQVPIPTTAAEVPGPVPGNKMTTAYVQFAGHMAYIWGYAMVNAHNRRAAFSEAPAPGLLGGVVPVAPVGYNAMLTQLHQAGREVHRLSQPRCRLWSRIHRPRQRADGGSSA